MNNAEMNILHFDERDVIATSALKTIEIANAVDGVQKNNSYIFGGTSYTSETINESDVANYFGEGVWTAVLKDGGYSIRGLVNLDTRTTGSDLNSKNKTNTWYNGTFSWDGSSWTKQ